MNTMLSAAVALMAVVATAVTLLAAIAWRRTGQGRMGLLFLGFALVACAGISTAVGLFTDRDTTWLLAVQSGLVGAGLFVVYLAAVKR